MWEGKKKSPKLEAYSRSVFEPLFLTEFRPENSEVTAHTELHAVCLGPNSNYDQIIGINRPTTAESQRDRRR